MELINAGEALAIYGEQQLLGKQCVFCVDGVMHKGKIVKREDGPTDATDKDFVLFVECTIYGKRQVAVFYANSPIVLSDVVADSEYSDTVQTEPTPDDYRELQRQYDDLQTELFNTRCAFSRYSLCVMQQRNDIDQALKILNAIHDSGVDLQEHEKPLREYLLEWKFARAPEVEIASHNAELIRGIAQNIRADYGHHTQYSVSLLAAGIEGYAKAEDRKLEAFVREKSKKTVLHTAAVKWLADHPDKDPQFSSYGSMIFDENEAAEDIGAAVIAAGEQAGFPVVSPEDIVRAVLAAKETRQQAEGSTSEK